VVSGFKPQAASLKWRTTRREILIRRLPDGMTRRLRENIAVGFIQRVVYCVVYSRALAASTWCLRAFVLKKSRKPVQPQRYGGASESRSFQFQLAVVFSFKPQAAGFKWRTTRWQILIRRLPDGMTRCPRENIAVGFIQRVCILRCLQPGFSGINLVSSRLCVKKKLQACPTIEVWRSQ
jgi:hypothetical protein